MLYAIFTFGNGTARSEPGRSMTSQVFAVDGRTSRRVRKPVRGFTRIESDMKSGFESIRNELTNMRGEMAATRDLLTGKIIEHTDRIAKVEEKKKDKEN